MAPTPAEEQWLDSALGRTVAAQIKGDPGIPQPEPLTSSWQVPSHRIVGHIRSETLPQTTDYLVIGTGVAGCGVVKSLLGHPGSGSATVTVLDARGVCSGATGRNGGQLVRPYPARFAQLMEDFGPETAIKVLRLANRTLEEMHKLAASYDDELRVLANARRVTKMAVYMDDKSWASAQEDMKLYEDNLPEERGKCKTITKEELESRWNVKGARGAHAFPAGVCWPYRLITGVFKCLRDQYPGRLNIETHTPATTILYDDKRDSKYPYIITTPRGIIRAGAVVHCTNAHASHLLPGLRGKLYPMREAMSAQDPGENFPDYADKISWTFLEEPSHNQKAGTVRLGWVYGLQNRSPGCEVWIGGEDRRPEEIISPDDSVISVQGREDLENVLPHYFNDTWVSQPPKIKGMWTGIVALTGDTLPLVGNLPASATGRKGTGEWIAAGWNQYGMTNGLTGGAALAGMMFREKPPAWFPEQYLPTEERLSDKKMLPQHSTISFMDWTGLRSKL